MPKLSPLELIAFAAERMRGMTSKERLAGNAAHVGRVFMQAADQVPDMFQRGRSFADDATGLTEQFGTGKFITQTPNSMSENLADHYNYRLLAERGEQGADSPQLTGSVYTMDDLMREALRYDSIRQADDAGLLPLGGRFHSWDTTGLHHASGQGSKVYPAAFGYLRTQPSNHFNISEGLTGVNKLRRSYNQANALMRDPALSERVIVSPGQLLAGEVGTNLKGFHASTPAQQVGILQMAAAQGALNTLAETLARDQRYLADKTTMEIPLKSEMRRRHVAGMDIAAPLFFDSRLARTEPAAGALARAYQASPTATSMGLGPRSLRRLGIVQDALDGRSFKELSDRFSGLEYRAGGVVALPSSAP